MTTFDTTAAMTAVALTPSTFLDAGAVSAAQSCNGVYRPGGLHAGYQTSVLAPGHLIFDGVEYAPAAPNGPHDVFHTRRPVRPSQESLLVSADGGAIHGRYCAEMMRAVSQGGEKTM